MKWIDWYDTLIKPTWTPAPATISLIWMILYPVILVSFGFVFVQAFWGKVPWRVALPFAVNLAANLLFMPIFSCFSGRGKAIKNQGRKVLAGRNPQL